MVFTLFSYLLIKVFTCCELYKYLLNHVYAVIIIILHNNKGYMQSCTTWLEVHFDRNTSKSWKSCILHLYKCKGDVICLPVLKLFRHCMTALTSNKVRKDNRMFPKVKFDIKSDQSAPKIDLEFSKLCFSNSRLWLFI